MNPACSVWQQVFITSFQDPGKVGYSLSAVGGTARLLAFIIILAGYKAYRDLLREREAGLDN